MEFFFQIFFFLNILLATDFPISNGTKISLWEKYRETNIWIADFYSGYKHKLQGKKLNNEKIFMMNKIYESIL